MSTWTDPDVNRRTKALRRSLVALLGAVACQACFAKEPAREAAPPATPPPAAAPEPSPPTPEEAPAAAPESAEPSRATGGAAEPKKAGPGVQATPRSAPGRAAPRQRSEASGLERDDSAADEKEEEARSKPKVGSAELLMQRLGTAVNLATPDCPSARERRRAICDLAAQICRLVDNDPNVASVVEYCSDARKRCSDAGQRIAERCQ